MSPMNSSIFLLLLSLNSIICSQNCKWLHPKQEYLNMQILQTFNQLNPDKRTPEACLNYIIELPSTDQIYNISQVGSAAIAVGELINHTIQFYRKYHQRLLCQQQAWERLQDLLHYQMDQLDDCITETAENHLYKQVISEQFNKLEKILQNQDKPECAQRFIHREIRKNLQLAIQLSSRMRKLHVMKISQ